MISLKIKSISFQKINKTWPLSTPQNPHIKIPRFFRFQKLIEIHHRDCLWESKASVAVQRKKCRIKFRGVTRVFGARGKTKNLRPETQKFCYFSSRRFFFFGCEDNPRISSVNFFFDLAPPKSRRPGQMPRLPPLVTPLLLEMKTFLVILKFYKVFFRVLMIIYWSNFNELFDLHKSV